MSGESRQECQDHGDNFIAGRIYSDQYADENVVL